MRACREVRRLPVAASDAVACAAEVCGGEVIPDIHSRRMRGSVVEAIADLVAEATEDYAGTDEIEAIEADAEQCFDEWLLLPEDDEPLPVHEPRAFNAATYAVLGDDW